MDDITKEEIINSLKPINNRHFQIADLDGYAHKVLSVGKSEVLRDSNRDLLSYVLYYDNRPDIFITMVWTREDSKGKGYAKSLIRKIIESTTKEITLEVASANPAKNLYSDLKFYAEDISSETLFMRYSRRLSVMQPYVFPYIGYFHLIEASDQIVFYDDVNFINRGWINRNRILMNNSDFLFTIPLEKASQNRLINDIRPIINSKFHHNLFGQIESAYKKAPFYYNVAELLDEVFKLRNDTIADLAINSILSVLNYLGKDIRWKRSSLLSPETRGMDKADRLIQITKNMNYNKYVNSIGGQDLYDKEYFKARGVQLDFVQPKLTEYKQYNDNFVPGLSIIDILMFNDKKVVKEMMKSYTLL